MIGPTRLTLETINAEIARRGGKEKLVRGQGAGAGYFYFINVGKKEVPGSGIMISRLNDYTLEQWMCELDMERQEQDGE